MCLPHGKEHEQAPSLFPSTLPLLHFSFTPSVAYALAVGDVQAFGREGGRDSRGRGQRQEVILSYLGNLNSGLKRVMVEKHQSEKNLWIVQIAAWQTALGRLHLDRQQQAAFGQRYAKLCIILSKTELRERKRERRSLSGAQQTGALFTHFLTRKLSPLCTADFKMAQPRSLKPKNSFSLDTAHLTADNTSGIARFHFRIFM